MGNALLLAAVKDRQAVALADAILPFDNLRLHEVESFWRAFYDSATSFALSKSQLRSICCRAVASGVWSLHGSNERIAEYANAAFELFADPLHQRRWQQVPPGARGAHSQQFSGASDELTVIDALEFLSAIAFIAAIPLDEKIDLLFDSWDMSEDGALDLDEFTISLKSTLSGLAKILQPTTNNRAINLDAVVDEEEVVMLAESTFREIGNCGASSSKEKATDQESVTITCEQFREYCVKNKRAKELLDLFDVADASPERLDLDTGDEGPALQAAEADKLVAKLEKHSDSSESPIDIETPLDTMQDDVGDMFLAVKPWIGAIVPPSKTPSLSRGAPLVSIQLDWVFGYSAQDCKNNVRFAATTANGRAGRFEEVVYPAAAACVVLNTRSMKQRHHLSHTDDVLSLCLHPRLPLAASGEIGKQPKIIVWDLDTTEVQCTLQGLHKRGVLHLAFMSAEMLVSIGGDDDHSIAIYESNSNWKSAVLKISVKGNKAVPFHIATNPRAPGEFMTCGQKYVEFWSLEGKDLVSKKGLLGKKGSLQPFPVAQYLETAVVVGTSDGSLYLFVGRQLTTVVKAHEGGVTALFYSSGLLLSGGRDGQIAQWDDKLKQVGSAIQIQDSLESSPLPQRKAIRSVCFSPDRRTILVGTLASEIYELDAKTGKNIHPEALTKGHFQGELWGLDAHPTKQQCCTVGDDQTLRIWDLAAQHEVGFVELPIPGRACAYSGDGKLIAVGLGTEDSGKAGSGSQAKKTAANTKKQQPNGGFVVYSAVDLTCAKEPCFDAKRWVSDVKFSPDNRTLAVASHDSKIYLYNVLKGFSRTHVFNKHSSYITHLDFSLDGGYLQSTSGGYELLFTEVKTGKHVTSASTFRDELWHTMTSTLGWSVQGIWEAESDGTDVNAVDRSNNGKWLATGDDFGKVKVFQYPCALEKASYLELRGHASHVTNVRWSPDDNFIISVGGNDRCVFVWKHDKQPTGEANRKRRVSETDSDSDGIELLDKRAGDPLEVAATNDDIGDEFMAVRPWLGAVVAPSKAASLKINNSSPNTRLELERVHGYQAQTASNNARYNSNGKAVYHTAALGVIFDKAAQRQTFFKNHDDDIVALCAHPNGTTFATSQMGKKPKIYVWDSVTGETLGPCLEGFHQRFVNAVCFSSDGLKLGSVGGDDDHSIAIYTWQTGLLSSQSRGERNNVRAICYHAATKEWVTCGDKHIRFWTEQGKNLTSKKAIFGTKAYKNGKVPSAFDCVVSFGQMVIAGSSTGQLLAFQSSVDVTKAIAAHDSAVLSLYATERELISGGKDSKIVVWDAQVNKVAAFDMKECTLQGSKLLNSEIRSVCSSSVSPRIFLVGTGGSDLFEFDAGRSQSALSTITRGHCKMEVWGLACHPTRPEYCTVGDDQTIRVWCLLKKIQLRVQRLECVSRACALTDTADIVAVGFGGRNAVTGLSKAAQAKTGGVVLLCYSDLTKKVFEDRPSKQAISEMKFSPNGAILAVGSHDHKIYLYRIERNATKVVKAATFDKHQSYITHLDFSADSQILQSNCGAYELLFSNAATGKHITSASSTKDTPWHSWTCVLGWPVQGIWPPCSDGTDVNAVARSSREDLLVTSDDFGLVKLYRYPCVAKNASSLDHRGHSSHVTNVRWSHDDSYVISIGGNDRSVMEWKVLGEHDRPPLAPEKQLSLAEAEEATDSSVESEEESFDDPTGDEFMAVKPWLGAIVAPTNAAAPNSREPDLRVELEWVYGYQSELSQQNLVYNAQDEIVYHTAAVGVIYDSANHLQKHHVGHNDDIISFALCDAKRDIIATGERGKKPSVRVWDAHTGELRCEMKEFHTRGILSLAFSSDSTRLVSVGDDDDHSLAVWSDASNGSWTLAKLLATGKGDKAVNRFACFGTNADTIITGGVKHVLFWSVQGKTIASKKGIVGKKGSLQTFPTGCNFGADFVTGTAGGELYVWRGNDLSRIVKAHQGEVRAVSSTSATENPAGNSSVLLSGGKDGRIVMWNSAYQSLKSFDLEAMHVGSFGRVINSVFLNATGKKVLVGTCSSDIIEIEVTSGAVLNGGQPLFSGHFAMELWGLAVHPSQREFVTVGDDRTLRVWDMDAKRLIQARSLPAKARACAYSPDSELLAVGFGGDNGVRQRRKAPPKQGQLQSREGGFAVLRSRDLDSEKLVFEDKPAKEWLSDVKFSPCGKLLALGSHDNSIYLYAVDSGASEFKKRKPFSKHNSYITHFDFSEDSTYIQSNCGAYEYLFCDTASSSQVSRASSVRDVKWATWTCTLGWPVQGIWPDCADGTDINAVCASSSRTILASGDDSGNVKFFRYPCIPKGSKFIACRGHSSHVANVRFSFDDKYVISVGGNDRSIFQWKLA